MEFMPDFSVLHPASIEEAVNLFSQNPGARYIAGGTDLVVNIRRGIEAPQTLIDLSHIAEMKQIESDGAGGYILGAGVTLKTIIDHQDITDNFDAVSQAAATVAAATHRQVATLGGNLCLDTRCIFYNQSEWWRSANDYCLKSRGDVCHVAPSGDHCFAAFSGDLAPALLVFDADVTMIGPEGSRTVPLNDIYTDDGAAHLLLTEGEILTAVHLPSAQDYRSGYAKVRVRDSLDFPLAGAAIAMKMGPEGLEQIKVALTGLNSCPIVLTGTDALAGHRVDEKALNILTALLPKQIQPMTSTMTPPGYRRKVATNLIRKVALSLNDR
ncbi:MAG: 4-hydroxybenzoyl-CoA reductase subunit beta [Rhodospirillaceae bacterium]|jgi:4-hydroxybenzoyl-CoA reductase subunit beta|nr:4-hydroxybenzoyl-CoA reductase subunit beta [Rhodospirillaceae bacterium]MBT5243857.1 4-hydroxybenzoyl-CoA reductase subunit beta [Rhodospirillaceae bacterium]MBT5562906.1 4-hydroxybenzoyl-CoA reductase subunit beta [Rhodospirillaceae bacterium]MBT6241305.1 4-hydroxybenzoyl-CoA reductase subunit beta [Rhodospirillaceae bacterium]MBT7138732.1 4-hydroxybenzoyl-CoA reductase subunit beta [Rhodospirillaceae bacterium]